MRFDSVNICEIEKWNEIRLKGKFIRVREKDGELNEWVIPKFFYSFEVEDDNTLIHIGIHQEDDRILGADRRRLLDLSFILFRIDDDIRKLQTIKTVDFVLEREVQSKMTLDEGSYIMVPLTTGALLQKPFKADDTPIEYKIEHEDITVPHPFFLSTLNDIFRKIDLALNGRLSAEELNQFGRIVGEKIFKKIRTKDFSSKAFKLYSCDPDEGLTNLGFKQFLFRNFEQDRIEEMFEKLGYDPALYSTKSRVFVSSFQADSPISVKINESIIGDMHTRAWDLFMEHQLSEGANDRSDTVGNSQYVFFKIDHSKAYGCSYGIANNTREWLKVELDLTKSKGCYFNPLDGTSIVLVPPEGVKYLGSCISDPDAQEFSFGRTFEVEETEAPEGYENREQSNYTESSKVSEGSEDSKDSEGSDEESSVEQSTESR
jgi:hypothetical protein